MRARLWFYGIAFLVILGLLFLMIPQPGCMITEYNHDGNFAALRFCAHYTGFLDTEMANNPTRRPLLLTSISPEIRAQFADIARPRRSTPNAHYLVSTQPFVRAEPEASANHKNRRIVIVCDMPYTNVPMRKFWHAPPTHAVGYSDETTGLISPAEFAKLDLSKFKRLDELFPPEPAR